MKRDTARLAAAVDVTTRAADRLRSSIEDDRELIVAAIGIPDDGLSKDQLRALDAFVQRFQQVHEHMTHRLYPALYRREEMGEAPPPMLRLLQWLERGGLIDDVRAWGRYAEARNRLVHEYPLDAQDRAAALSAALTFSSDLLLQLDRALAHVNARGLIEDSPEP